MDFAAVPRPVLKLRRCQLIRSYICARSAHPRSSGVERSGEAAWRKRTGSAAVDLMGFPQVFIWQLATARRTVHNRTFARPKASPRCGSGAKQGSLLVPSSESPIILTRALDQE